MASLTEQQIHAAQVFTKVTLSEINTERGVHAETAIAATARMAGTFLFRSFGFQLEGVVPGQPVLSDKANEHGPALVEILGGVLTQLGVALDSAQLANEVPDANQPLLKFLETQPRLEPRYARVKDRFGLSLEEAAGSAAAAAAFLIQQTADVLDPHLGFNIAAYGFIEGSKTAPAPVAQ